MALSFANVEQGELLVYEYYGSSAWIISPEDGRVLAERTTEGDDKIGLPVWVPSVHAFVYYSIEQKAMVLLLFLLLMTEKQC